MSAQIKYTTKINSNLTTDVKACKSVEVYKEMCENFNVYELIPDDKPIHPYFDFDYYNESDTYSETLTSDMIELAKKYLINVFEYTFSFIPEFCCLSSSSSNYFCSKSETEKWKISFHIIIKNCLMMKKDIQNLVEQINKYAKEQKGELNFTEVIYNNQFFDESVYNNNMKLRAWNASKEGENRPLIIVEGSFEDSIITHIFDTEMPLFEFKKQQINPIGTTINKVEKSNEYIQKYRDYVSIINKEEYLEPYESWYKFQRASANINIPFEVYDEFMKSCRNYNYEENKKTYEMPENNKNGRLGWGYIFEIAKESNPEMKSELDSKYGKPNFCKYKFMKIKLSQEEENTEKINQYFEEISKLEKQMKEMEKMKISDREITKLKKQNDKEIEKYMTLISSEKDEALYLKRKAYFEKFHFKLMSKVCYGRFKEDGFDFLTEEKLKSLYRYVEDFISKWVRDINIREYEDVDFKPPPLPHKRDIFNLFTGFEYEKNLKCVSEITQNEIIQESNIFIKHLWYLSGKNNNVLDYVLKYLAHLIQETGTLPRTSIVFKSEQGVGKNIFFENFAEKILGEQYLLATANLDHIIGRFPMISKKLLVLMDEANGKESFIGSDKIKSFITAKSIPFEQKGIDPIMIRNCSRMLFFTNNDYPVKIEQSDRRFIVVECSSEIKNDTLYFKNLLSAFNNKKTTTAFALFLKQMDLSNFDTTNDRPITRIYKEVQTATIPTDERYFIESDFDEIFFSDRQKSDSMYDSYVFWCENSKKKYVPIKKQTFLSRIKKYEFIETIKSSGLIFYKINKIKLDEFIENQKQKEELEDDPEDEFPKMYE
jgi:hypothetical protein